MGLDISAMTRRGWHYALWSLTAIGALHCNDTATPDNGQGGGVTSVGGADGGGMGGEGGEGGDDTVVSCDPGQFGPNCEDCACGSNGECDDGLDGTGACSCSAGWAGDQCDTCAPAHYGASCSICTCGVHGTCDEGIAGTGACTCEDGWGGASCQTCEPARYGLNCESTCPVCAFGKCDEGQTGTGECCITAGMDAHVNEAIVPQMGSFTAEWDGFATAQTDAIFGLTVDGAANDWDDFAVAVRFGPLGLIDARDGGAYDHDISVPYSAGSKFHFRMAVDLATHTYSVWVTPSGGAEVQVALDYGFRTSLNTVTELGNAAARAQTNAPAIQLCNLAVVAN